jgi:hypothetical protein
VIKKGVGCLCLTPCLKFYNLSNGDYTVKPTKEEKRANRQWVRLTKIKRTVLYHYLANTLPESEYQAIKHYTHFEIIDVIMNKDIADNCLKDLKAL